MARGFGRWSWVLAIAGCAVWAQTPWAAVAAEGLGSDARRPAWQDSVLLASVLLVAGVGGFLGAWVGRRSLGGSADRAPRTEVSAPVVVEQPAAAETPVAAAGEPAIPALEDPPAAPPTAAEPLADEDRRILAHLRATFGQRLLTLEGTRRFFDDVTREIAALRERSKGAAGSAGMPVQDGLVAWLLAAGRAMDTARARLAIEADYAEFDEVLQLEGIEAGLAALRESVLAGRSPGDLLGEPWVQNLLRAEAICHAYYPTTGGWGHLRFGLVAAAAGIRGTLRERGQLVEYVRLLAPSAGEETEQVYDERLTLRGLSAASRVLQKLVAVGGAGGGLPLVVDCVRFGSEQTGPAAQRHKSKVVVYNPADRV